MQNRIIYLLWPNPGVDAFEFAIFANRARSALQTPVCWETKTRKSNPGAPPARSNKKNLFIS